MDIVVFNARVHTTELFAVDNYVHVDVQPGKPTKFTLNRFRPWAAEPFQSVELFK